MLAVPLPPYHPALAIMDASNSIREREILALQARSLQQSDQKSNRIHSNRTSKDNKTCVLVFLDRTVLDNQNGVLKEMQDADAAFCCKQLCEILMDQIPTPLVFIDVSHCNGASKLGVSIAIREMARC